MTILVCGDRKWTNVTSIVTELTNYPAKETTIVHGAAKGADNIAGVVGKNLGMTVKAYPAKWEIYGKAAGSIRNQQMLLEGKPDLVIAFHSNINQSKGTKDMLMRAKANGIPTKLITE